MCLADIIKRERVINMGDLNARVGCIARDGITGVYEMNVSSDYLSKHVFAEKY